MKKRRKHEIFHTEYYKEKSEITNMISEFMKVSSSGKLEVFIRRAAALVVNESVNEFCSEIDNYADLLTFHTFKVLAVQEVHDSEIKGKIIEYKNIYHSCLLQIINLKATVSLEEKTKNMKQIASREINDIENEIRLLKDKEEEISNEMQKILIEYSKRVRQ